MKNINVENRPFIELVNIAYKEIEKAMLADYDWFAEWFEHPNWAEICDWCGFPDIQHSDSLYERAINMAVFHILVRHNMGPNDWNYWLNEYIVPCWETRPIVEPIENFEDYRKG